jgi:hypothetical protein
MASGTSRSTGSTVTRSAALTAMLISSAGSSIRAEMLPNQ